MKTLLLLGATVFSLVLAEHGSSLTHRSTGVDAASTDGNCSTDHVIKGLQTDIQNVQKLLARYFNDDKGAGTAHTTYRPRGGGHEVFVHWGRKQCSHGTTLIYSGFAGGNYYGNKGGASNLLCLPQQPLYSNHTAGAQASGQVYGTEYHDIRTSPNMNHLLYHDVPCAVCETRHQASVLMIPARNECYPGWKRLYWGYLMAGYITHSSSEYICMDKDPERNSGGHEKKYGQLLYLVESICGSLQCPPYLNQAELTCIVCAR